MSDVVNKTTLQYLKSVNTPDYPTEDWLINPDLSALSAVPQMYWKVSGELVLEMTQAEKDVVDAANAPSRTDASGVWVNDAPTSNDDAITRLAAAVRKELGPIS